MASKKSAHRIIIEQLQREQDSLKALIAGGELTRQDAIELTKLDGEISRLEEYADALCARIDSCKKRITDDVI